MRLLKRIWARIKTKTFFRNKKTTKEIDDFFKKELENPVFEFESSYSERRFKESDIIPFTILLNNIEIWVGNEYYASPFVYKIDTELPYMDTTVDFFKAYYKFLRDETVSFEDKLKKIRNV